LKTNIKSFTGENLDKLIYATVRIESLDGDNCIGTGTGFFFNFLLGNSQRMELILTNKHVIHQNAKALRFCLHEAQDIEGNLTPTGTFLRMKCDDFLKYWFPHPDPNIDLGALLFTPIKKHINDQLGKYILTAPLTQEHIKNDKELKDTTNIAEQVLMLGYPLGLWDEHNGLPIARQGIAATPPAIDYLKESKGLVDIACFGGSSGSPIIICKHENFHTNKMSYFRNKFILLGLLSSGYLDTQQVEVEIKEIPTAISTSVVTNTQTIYLGIYVKAKEILVLCEEILKLLSNVRQES